MYLAQSTDWGHFQIELEFRSVGFWGERKTGVPGEKHLDKNKRQTHHI